MTALRTNRVNHAYLFSGPRGCGKTTSARILARCLNCAEGPTDTPCGVCPSCVELARDGGGSLDVVEIDAASHNGVDDARDIRERAINAPARDRYKIFILDEAHMVTPQGFNALLKIVEEPPEHVKFIFATTEPEKVIGTIRSRTHHYPFRLVPPGPMLEYVQQMCETENMQVAPGVLPLVVRAGGGSPRDTLSLLDQLMAGSDGDSIEYDRAVALLGYTSASLLDEAINAIGTRDSAAAFDAVDRVIQTGQDPRRFVEDLLERMRDLILVAATSAAGASAVLRGVPQDELDRMAVQASQFGAAELSRTADILNAALSEMGGATSPRLHLELMIARALIPATDDSTRGALARVERLERRVGVAGGVDAGEAGAGAGAGAGAARAEGPAPVVPVAAATPAPRVTPSQSAPPAAVAAPAPAPTPARVHPVGPVSVQQLRDAWPEVLEAVRAAKVSAWLVVYSARVLDLRDGEVLVLSFPGEADVTSFKKRPAPGQGISDFLRAALLDVLGLAVKFVARVDPGGHREAPEGPTGGPGDGPGPSGNPGPSGGPGDGPSTVTPAEPASGEADAPQPSDPQTQPAPVAGADPAVPAAPTAPRATATSDAASESVAPVAAALTPAPSPPALSGPSAPAPAASTTGWATVAIPGSAGGAVAAPVAAPVAEIAVTAASVSPAGAATAGQAAPTAVSSAAQPAPAAAASPRAAWETEEPPPFDDTDAPPDADAPPDEPYAATPYVSRPTPAKTPAASTPAAPAAPGSVAGSGSAPMNRAASGTAASRASSQMASKPGFSEKQRYGEAVIREILGASFIEEQPHDSTQRPRGA